MSRQNKFSIEWAGSVGEVPDDLWARCFAPPLEGRWWYAALEAAGLGEQFEFLYAVIRAPDGPVGLAPVFVMDVPIDLVAPPLIARLLRGAGRLWPRLRYQRTVFVGSPCADEGTVGLLPGVSLDQVATALQDALEALARQRRAAMIVWKDFPEAAWGGLDQLAAARGFFPVISYPGTCLPLACGDFEGYLTQRLGAHDRQKLRRKLRQSEAMGAFDAAILQHPDPALLGEIYQLFMNTYTRGKTKFERLTPQFFAAIAADEHAWFVTLRDPNSGGLVAFKLMFLVPPRVIHKYIGLDYRYCGNWYLYFRLVKVGIDWAARRGAVELQSGQTGYSAKLDLGYQLVPLTNYCRHRNRLLHHLFGAVARRITWVTLDEDLRAHVEAHGDARARERHNLQEVS